MTTLIFVLIFLLGAIIGSFLNVVIFRLNTGKTIVTGSSICMTCNRNLRWFELVPLISFIIQGGKCRRCKEVISWQYPIVEFVTGLVFVFVALRFIPVLLFFPMSFLFLNIFFLTVFSVLIVIAVYDVRHKVIPNGLVYLFTVLSIIAIFVNFSGIGPFFVIPSVSYFLSGPLLAIPFALLWFFSRGKLMGLGDVKLMVGIGWLLGLSMGAAAILLSFWVGAVISLILMAISHKKMNMKTQVPFAPFLIISTFIVFFFSIDFMSLIRLFNF